MTSSPASITVPARRHAEREDARAMRVVILFNPISGKGEAARHAERLSSVLVKSGIEANLVSTQRAHPSEWLAPSLVGAHAVVVVGGDGAVRLVARAASEAGTPLYHYPAGTENLFARQFGSRGDSESLLAALRRGRQVPIDVGECVDPDRPDDAPEDFTIMASCGFDAAVVHSLAASRRGGISHLSYVPAILGNLPRWSAPTIAVSIDHGEAMTLGRGIVVVANAPAYALRADPARGADPSDGLLDVAFLPCTHGAGSLAWGFRGLLSRAETLAGSTRLRGRVVEVHCDPAAPWQADGDAIGDAAGARRRILRVRRSSLHVLLPPPPAR